MTACFVDTNLFIRYLTNDDPVKAERVERLLNDAAAGKVRLVTAEMVIAEVVWLLESSYALKSTQVAPLVRAILATSGLEVLNAPGDARTGALRNEKNRLYRWLYRSGDGTGGLDRALFFRSKAYFQARIYLP
jgi:predicted nucleic acid-binding protein